MRVFVSTVSEIKVYIGGLYYIYIYIYIIYIYYIWPTNYGKTCN